MRTLLVILALLFSMKAIAAPESRSTISVCGGTTVSNSIKDEKSHAWCIEQETPTSRGTWLFGYLNEGHLHGDKRDGIYALYKFPHNLTPRVETSVAAGPYYTATTVTEADGVEYRDVYCLSLLATAGVKVALDDNWSTQFRWSHAMFTRNNRHDTDVFAIHVGYKPKGW